MDLSVLLIILNIAVLCFLVWRVISMPNSVVRDVKKSHEAIHSEIRNTQSLTNSEVVKNMSELSRTLTANIETSRTATSQNFQNLDEAVSNKLDRIRETVDTQLQTTLKNQFSDSFNIVSERLESVQRGFGEMQNLAQDVGDLQRTLTNVNTRGVWGELQLGTIIKDILTSEQYAEHVAVKSGSSSRVEYAIKFPGNSEQSNDFIWMPVDSKFPLTYYQSALDASESNDKDAFDSAINKLVRTIRTYAKDINEKYICPPNTTDFAVMFLPTEGLYAEILRQSDLISELILEHKVIVSGPTNLTAILLGLRVGFKTLAVNKHSRRIHEMLSDVKTEFSKFSEDLEKTQRHIQRSFNALEETHKRSQSIVNNLNDLEKIENTS